jgi:hypothetical protein
MKRDVTKCHIFKKPIRAYLDALYIIGIVLVARHNSYLIIPGVFYQVGFGDRIAKKGTSM